MGTLLVGAPGSVRDALTIGLESVEIVPISLGEDPGPKLRAAADRLDFIDGMVLVALPEEDSSEAVESGWVLTSRCTHWFATRLAGTDRTGRIVHVIVDPPTQATESTNHAVRKAGLLSLASASAREFGPIGIRINSLVVSDPTDLARSPLRRAYMPQELAGAAAFLLGEESSYMTGAVVRLDGGSGAGVAGY